MRCALLVPLLRVTASGSSLRRRPGSAAERKSTDSRDPGLCHDGTPFHSSRVRSEARGRSVKRGACRRQRDQADQAVPLPPTGARSVRASSLQDQHPPLRRHFIGSLMLVRCNTQKVACVEQLHEDLLTAEKLFFLH